MTTKASVRFKDTPVAIRSNKNNQHVLSSTGKILSQEDDDNSSSFLSDENDKENVTCAGRTPHAKMVEALETKKCFEDLLKIPPMAVFDISQYGASPVASVEEKITSSHGKSDIEMSSSSLLMFILLLFCENNRDDEQQSRYHATC